MIIKGKEEKMGLWEFLLKMLAILILLTLVIRTLSQLLENATTYNQNKTETSKSK
jgi:hypothetical protein